MSVAAVLAPLFVQMALTFALLLWLVPLRLRALDTKVVRPRDIALGQKAWPEQAQKVSNCFQNQFELPLLFYVTVIIAVITRSYSLAFVILSWIFVASRFAHGYIHTGRNNIRVRGMIYGIGMLALLVMWIMTAVRVLLA